MSADDPIAAVSKRCERPVVTYLIYIAAGLAEIAGCFAFWAWLRLDRSAFWVIPGVASLCLFAYLLTLISVEYAGRTYAAYGGIYIASALAWLWVAEGIKPDRWDIIGGAVCLVGASIILWGPRPA
jgi:small multidrug resistance family-3 protein|tara:strand:- start:250 stop:627 length:378 start_codon:yes stop_codon:yes gene_type:complete